jgi:predicted phosphodiesterase
LQITSLIFSEYSNDDMSKAIVLSDTHWGKESDTLEQRAAKEQATNNIADYAHAVRAKMIIVNGDGLHHTDGKLKDFDDTLAARQFGPVSEVWRAQGSELVDIAGNTDKWLQFYHQQQAVRDRLHAILNHDGKGRLTVPAGGLVYKDACLTSKPDELGIDLFTHGHIFAPTSLVTKVRAVLGNPAAAGRFGGRILKASNPDADFYEFLRTIDESGSHRKDYLLSLFLGKGLGIIPPLKRAAFRHLKQMHAQMHMEALAEAARIVTRTEDVGVVKTAWMGHTHKPQLSQNGEVLLVNTGTAGAEKSVEATFGEVTSDGKVRLMRAWHRDSPHTVEEWKAA